MQLKRFIVIFIVFHCFGMLTEAQQVQIRGSIANNQNQPVAFANIIWADSSQIGTTALENGEFSLQIPSLFPITIKVTAVGFTDTILRVLSSEKIKVQLNERVTKLSEVKISSGNQSITTIKPIHIKIDGLLPSTNSGIESIIKTMPGVSSRNELSSQYSVRGGNFDENLVYINGIEIYRPFLIKSGKQEGLSVVNSSLVSSVQFSAGGFDAMYGDKMSSVLDITYKSPQENSGSAEISLLGGSFHLEGTVKNKFSYLIGARHRTTEYLLNSMDTDAEYKPRYSDIQSLITYKANTHFTVSFLGNYSLNNYQFIPITRETSFGTRYDAYSFKVYYEGQEIDRFENYFGALNLSYTTGKNLLLRFSASSFSSSESETYDILGEYLINELDNTVGSETSTDSILNIGVGKMLDHARNYLEATVYSIQHSGFYNFTSNQLRWGINWKQEQIDNQINEWKLIDSAGYTIPSNNESLILEKSIKAAHTLNNSRLNAYVQNTSNMRIRNSKVSLTYGIRYNYWEFNDEHLLSPRANITVAPWFSQRLNFYLAGGVYYQAPFFREIQRPDGSLNKHVKAQKSTHLVLGSELDFSAWGRPFKLTSELYYKWLDDLIPYKVDNVQIQYAGENISSGYAKGIDLKINGEFVKGIESWLSLSFMKTEEDIEGDTFVNDDGETVEIGEFLRPGDQRILVNLFFQDYVPTRPDYQVYLNLVYGSKTPFSPPETDRYDTPYTMPPYRRVDIGFSKEFMAQTSTSNIKSFRIGIEAFNLVDIKNTISFVWVRTVGNQLNIPNQFAVPNYLTGRRFNVKASLKF